MSDPLTNLKTGWIGIGRLGETLAIASEQAGLHVSALASRNPQRAQALSNRLKAAKVLTPQQVADQCDLVFITTSDSAIEDVARQITWRSGTAVVHCSGATSIDVLAHAARQGAQTGGFHPMQNFGSPDAAIKTLPGCTITIQAEEPLLSILGSMAQRLGCKPNILPAEYRALYHAAAGYASQFVNALLDEAASLWKVWGADEKQALDALIPLVEGTLASMREGGIRESMPGPVSRGDSGSIHKHLDALQTFKPDALPVYNALCRQTVRIAESVGKIDPSKAQELLTRLDSAGAGRD